MIGACAGPVGRVIAIKRDTYRNMARTARGSLRSTRFPCPVPASLMPIKCSLHIAVFEVPSVIDWVPTAPVIIRVIVPVSVVARDDDTGPHADRAWAADVRRVI